MLPAALLAAGALISASACSAQPYAVRGPYVDVEQRAHDYGYREGFEQGRNDARSHRSYSLDRHGEYRDAGRDSRRGDDGRAFRRGFEAGYREAFDRYARGDGRR